MKFEKLLDILTEIVPDGTIRAVLLRDSIILLGIERLADEIGTEEIRKIIQDAVETCFKKLKDMEVEDFKVKITVYTGGSISDD